MRQLETTTNAAQDISATLLVNTYTAEQECLVFLRIFVDGVVGGGDYTAYLTVQRAGAGSEFHIVPFTVTPVDIGITAIALTTVAIPVDTDDIVRTYLDGVAADTSVTITTEVWEDDSNFYDAVGGYPTGTLGNALFHIGTSPTVRVQVPIMDNSRLQIVRGDDYVADHDTAITLTSDQWPDLTGATVELTSSQLTTQGSVLGPGEVMVELTRAQTALLDSGYFSLVATFTDNDEVTLIPRLKVMVLDRMG